jgi:hypothetical protein
LLDVPFISKHRGFVNLAYQTENEKWLFDFTAQYYGSKRLPKTAYWQHSHGGQTEGYFILHGQITRNWEKFSLYIGAENLTDFMQHEPIVAADKPYSEKFDAGMIWAPVMGRMTYIGMRFSIK